MQTPTVGGLAGVRVRAGVGELVAVGRASAEEPPLQLGLCLHRGPDADFDPVANSSRHTHCRLPPSGATSSRPSGAERGRENQQPGVRQGHESFVLQRVVAARRRCRPARVRRQDRDIDGQDVVLWHTFGSTYFPRPEDWPVMAVEYCGFTLKPSGIFDRNPHP